MDNIRKDIEPSKEEIDEAMKEMECWHVDNHLKNCKNHRMTRENIARVIGDYFYEFHHQKDLMNILDLTDRILKI